MPLQRMRVDPVGEHRRRLLIQWLGLAALVLVAIALVVKALEVP